MHKIKGQFSCLNLILKDVSPRPIILAGVIHFQSSSLVLRNFHATKSCVRAFVCGCQWPMYL